MDEMFATTTSTGHRITVEQVGTGFEVLINGTVIAVYSQGFGSLEQARRNAEAKAASRAADIEADARFITR